MKLKQLDNDDYELLLKETKKLKLTHNGNRINIDHRKIPPYSNSYGHVKLNNVNYSRGKSKEYPGLHISKLKYNYPEYQNILDRIVDKYFPPNFFYNCVVINRNFKCLPHKDKHNIGDSIIVAIGNFTGGYLKINDEEYDINGKPLLFDGSNTHSTTDFDGTRYSLVFFNNYSFNYRVCIPSYKRPQMFFTHTYKYLVDNGIDLNLVDLFLHNKEEEEQYRKLLDNRINIIVHGQNGIGATRNFIQSYYYENNLGDNIFSIDDDIKQLNIKLNEEEKKITKLNNFIISNFGICHKEGCKLWGISPYNNKFFLHEDKTTKLKYIPGGAFGFIVDREHIDGVIHTAYDHLEDFEFSCINFLRYGKVLRFNNVSMTTKFFNPGGINETYGGKKARQEATKKACEEFKAQYGDMCKIKKKPQYYSILLNSFFKV
jgi:hypothetical protein